jgi:hypothetical protein
MSLSIAKTLSLLFLLNSSLVQSQVNSNKDETGFILGVLVESAFSASWVESFKKTTGKKPTLYVKSDNSKLGETLYEMIQDKKLARKRNLIFDHASADFLIICNNTFRQRLINRRIETIRIVSIRIYQKQLLVWEGEFRLPQTTSKG